MPTSPATPETDLPLSPERLKIEPMETVGTVVTSADEPPSPEGPRVQPGEAAVTAMTVVEPLLPLASAETPPFLSESLPTESVVSAEVPHSPEEPMVQP